MNPLRFALQDTRYTLQVTRPVLGPGLEPGTLRSSGECSTN